jgi:two-component system chemotaxis response regulator CheY
MVERALRSAGVSVGEVFHASNGQEALQILRSECAKGAPPELIACDVNMPVMDGLEFLEQKQREKLAEGVPVVMITTEGGEKHVRRAIAAGASGYICKPFVIDHIKQRVLPLLKQAGPIEQTAPPPVSELGNVADAM